MKRVLTIILSIAICTLIPINNAYSAKVNPKFTVIFERNNEISCSEDQKNIVIDFTNYYTTIYRTNTYNSKFSCNISLAYDKPNFTKIKNGELTTHVQVFENDSWIRALKFTSVHPSATNSRLRARVTFMDSNLDLFVLNKLLVH